MNGRILVAGIGNIFFGDDGFGVEVARRLAQRPLPECVRVEDFGIRGMDLSYTLLDGFDALILVDTATGGEKPGTLYLIEPELEGQGVGEATLDTHGMDPVKVLNLARALGAPATPTFLVACEPMVFSGDDDTGNVLVELSAPVLAMVDEAVIMVESLVERLLNVSTRHMMLLQGRG